jgi:hypothetical protein
MSHPRKSKSRSATDRRVPKSITPSARWNGKPQPLLKGYVSADRLTDARRMLSRRDRAPSSIPVVGVGAMY